MQLLTRGLLVCTLALSAPACGGIAVFGDEGTGGDAASSSRAASTVTRASVGITAGTTGGSPNIVPTIQAVRLRGGCKPPYPEDPLEGEIDVRYENLGGGTGQLVLERAQVTFATDFEGWSFAIAIDPTSSGPVSAGSPVTTTHFKVATPGDSSFLCDLCFLHGTLTLEFQGDVQAQSGFSLNCAL